jgi:hypothetical protein
MVDKALHYPLHAGQQEVYCAGEIDGYRYIVLVAGRRWGKGELAAARLVAAAYASPRHFAYIAPSYRMARRIEWAKVIRWAELIRRATRRRYDLNRSDLILTWDRGGSVALYGADNPDSLRGIDRGFAGVVLDEFDLFMREPGAKMPYVWEAIVRPALADSRGWAQIQGTPDGFGGLYEAYRRDGEVEGWKSFHFRSIDNPLLDPAEIEEARRTTDPRLFRQEWEASFEAPAGRVYDTFSRAENVRECPFDAALPVYVGMDFNVDPMSAVLAQRHGPEWWVVEAVELQNAHTAAMADFLRKRLRALYGSETYPEPQLWVDPTARARQHAMGTTDVEVLRGHGFQVHWRQVLRESDKYNSVRAQILSASGERRLFIDPSCRRLIDRLEQLAYDDDDDHLTDALGYLIFGVAPRGRSEWA